MVGRRVLGRLAELGVLVDLLDRAPTVRDDDHDEHAAAVVVRGEAGQGKTALLDWVTDEGRDRGFIVVRATGVEFEHGLAFSGLTAALRPLLPRIDELPPAQADALRGALGLGPARAAALTVYGATLSLLSLGADDAPVLVVVDDAQWLDIASLEAFVFAAHRSAADAVGFVFAQRVGHPTLLDQARFATLGLGGLDRDAAVALLEPEGLAAAVAARCWRLTQGNPLALLEGARGLSPAQRRGDAPLPAVLPVDDRLLDDYRDRLAALPAATLRALGVAALAANDDVGIITSALAGLGGESDDLAAAERAGVVTLARGRARWRHPLLRCAVHSMLSAGELRATHRSLAGATADAGRDGAVWHLADSVTGPDDEVAAQLAATAGAAERRGALAAAAEAYEQAANLSHPGVGRDRLLIDAADARWTGGDFEQAALLMRDALGRTVDPVVRAEMAVVLGQTEVWLSGAQRSADMLAAQAREILPLSPAMAAVLLLNASVARLFTLEMDAARRTAEAAASLADDSGDPEVTFGAHAIAALCRFFAGEGAAAEVAIDPISQVAIAAVRESFDWRTTAIALLCAFAQITRGDADAALDMLGPVIAGDVSHALGRTVLAQVVRADALWRTGRWTESLAEASQLLSLHEATGRLHVRMCVAAVLARIAAGLGQEDYCRRYAGEAIADATQVGISYIEAWGYGALGLVDLGAGRHGAAAAHFDQVTRIAGHMREPGVLLWLADAVEAYHGCGRRADAAHTLSQLEDQAAATGRRWAVAAAARSAALLRPDDDAEAAFRTALDGFRALGAPFEEARTLLARAEHRTRVERRRDGALDAAAARTIFDRLGARDWSERATTLRGEPAGAATSLAARLTPAELRVALAVGRGRTSREVAAALYVSERTVEYHLQNIYRKLDLSTRSQLAALLATEGAGAR